MVHALLALGFIVLQTPVDTASNRPYLDPGARDLLSLARERRGSSVGAIRAYHADVSERMFFGVRAFRRDRVLYRKEIAARLAWHRGAPDTVQLVGAREAVPVVTGDPSVPGDLAHDSPALMFDPASPRLEIGVGDSSFVYDPIASGGEGSYQYRSGDTTEIGSSLPDGRTTHLVELRVIPRREEFNLMAGSIWIDGATGDVVARLFRPARPYDFQRDASPEERAKAHVPRVLEPIRAEVRFITVEYALVDNRWWLPWMVALDGVATLGSLAVMPMRYERVYSDYEVEGDTMAARTAQRAAPLDSDSIVVRVPQDSAGLLASAYLPAPFLEAGPITPFTTLPVDGPPRTGTRLDSYHWLARYNRVEGLSGGVATRFSVGGWDADLSARLGVSDRTPNAELGVGHETRGARLKVAAFRRLAVANPSTNPLGIVNSLDALLLGRDDGGYYRAWGGELTVEPALTAAQRFALRIFWQHETRATTTTQASLAHWLQSAHRFEGDIEAATANEFGTSLTLRALHSELQGDVALGSFDFARARLTTDVTASLPAGIVSGLELALGTSAGSVPAQSLWYLGGPGTLRGYDGLANAGETFWRTRVELATALPVARLVAFSDAGWAGPRAARFRGRALASVGGGASFLDGLFRVDLARALRTPVGWRLDVYVNGVL